MIVVTVLDKKSAKHKRSISAAAKILAKELGQEKKYLEIFIVGNKELYKNVLSFTADQAFPRPDLKEPALGELYINPTYIKEHGEDLMHMLVHGILHLLGHDHESSRDRMKMEKQEDDLLALLAKQL